MAGVAAPAEAAKSKKVSVTLSPRGEFYNSTDRVTFKSTLSYGKKKSTVRLQRLDAGLKWTTIKSVKLKKTGRQTVYFPKVYMRKGRWEMRVITNRSGSYRAASSRDSAKYRTAVHRVACDNRLSNVASGTRAYFSNPGTTARSKRSTVLTNSAQQVICSAAKGAVIRVATWSLADDGLVGGNVVNPIFSALDYVKKYRGVKVTFVLDGATTKDPTTMRWLSQIGSVRLCKLACMSDRRFSSETKVGSQHSKFITVSKNGKGVPAVLMTTSNLTSWQLRDYWNSSVVVWNDTKAYGAMQNRFDNMYRSAGRTKAGNPGWTESLIQIPGYRSRTWVPRDSNETLGSTAGLAVSLSPINRQKTDPLYDRLGNATCSGVAGGSVKITTLYLAGHDGAKAVENLERLHGTGCAINVVISKPINLASPVRSDEKSYNQLIAVAAAANKVRAKSFVVKCATFSHGKNYVFHAKYKNVVEKTVMTGSRNLIPGGTDLSDETMFRFTGNTEIFDAFTTDVARIGASGSTNDCPPTYKSYSGAAAFSRHYG